jgi:hypothetical protein
VGESGYSVNPLLQFQNSYLIKSNSRRLFYFFNKTKSRENKAAKRKPIKSFVVERKSTPKPTKAKPLKKL